MQYIYHHFTEAYNSIIHTNWLLHANAEINQEFVLLWTTENVIFLGAKDAQITTKTALDTLPYPYLIRSSGGRAVVNDEGIVNLSYFTCEALSVDEAYQKMKTMIENLLNIQTEAFEVVGSYCSGRFDLSINGKKIAGMSQRRYKNSIVVMAYISLYGDQQKRSKIIQHFYQVAHDDTMPIDPNTMAVLNKGSLQEMLQHLHKKYELLEVAPFLRFYHSHPDIIHSMTQQFNKRQLLLEENHYGKSTL